MRYFTLLLALCLPELLCATALRTTDGLALELADDGSVAGLTWPGQRLPVVRGGGFYALDAAAPAGERRLLRCPMLPDSGMLIQKQRFDDMGLTLETSWAGAGEYLSFSAKLTDHTGQDRAIEAGFEIPFDGTDWTWADDLNHSRRITEAISYRTTSPCDAGGGQVQLWPCSALDKGSAGLSLGVPLAQGPRVCFVEYDHARKCLAIRFFLGLSPQVKKLPGQAWFSFLLYAHDGRWGRRAALDRYLKLFAKDFARRAPTEGFIGALQTEACDGLRTPPLFYGVPALGDFGGLLWSAGRVEPGPATELAPALDALEQREPRRDPYTWCLGVDSADPQHLLAVTPDAVAASEAPLSYDPSTHAVGAVDGAWRVQAKLVAPLAEQHKLLLSRRFPTASPGLCADWALLDVGLVDAAAPAEGDGLFRAAAGRRLLRFRCDNPDGARGEQPLREMLSRGLLYAIYPNLQLDAPRYRDLYLQYVPVLERLSATGWEPVTLASSGHADLRLERYGRPGDGNLCLAVRNVGTQAATATVRLDPALGVAPKPADVHVMDLLADMPVAALVEDGALALPVRLAPGEATALQVLPRGRYLQQALLDATDLLEQAAPLSPEEITYQLSRPGDVVTGDTPPGAQVATILCDRWKTDQGLVFSAGEPLTINLDLNSPHRLQWVRATARTGDGYGVPEATLEGVDREGTWHKLATLTPDKQPARLPGAGASLARASAQPVLLADITDAGEYQRLRLVYPELKQRLWLKEIEIAGRDGALVRAAERFRAQAASKCDDFGVIGQLAMMLRVRRMVGYGRTLQERALTALADFCTATSGVSVHVEVAADAPPSGPAKGQVVIHNRGEHALREGSIKLKLPPGWSAAPGKFEAALAPGEAVRLPVMLSRPPEGGRLTLLVTGVLDGTPLFMSRQE